MSDERPDPGQGVYETVLVAGGRVHALDAHLERLERSTRELYGLSLSERTRAMIERCLAESAQPARERRARIDAVPKAGGLDVGLVLTPVPARRPVSLTPIVVPGGLGRHKWCDRRLVDRHGPTPTPLIVDSDDTVLEAGWANLWLLDGDRLITPPADGRLLPGVTRARLLALAPSLGYHAHEERITLGQARAASRMFLTSSLRLAVPAAFAGQPPPSPEVDRIRDALLAA